MRRIAGMFVVLAVATVAVPGVFAQDWPQWRGPNRDGVAAGFRAPQAWPAELKLKWKVTVGEGHSSPVVVGKRVFIFTRQGEKETLTALELESGKVAWQDGYEAPYTMNSAAEAHGKGPKSTPVAAGGRIYTLGISGILSSYDAQTGKLRWRKEFSREFREGSPWYGTAMSPVVERGLLIAHVGGHDSGALVAFDADTGAVRWRWAGDGPGYASPIVVDVAGTRQVVTQSQENIIGVAAETGRLLWKLPFTTQYTQNSVTPLVYKDLLIFSGYGTRAFAVRLEKQGEAWKAVEAWRNQEVPMYMSSPVLSGNLLVGMTHRNRGQIFVLDAATGKTLWKGEGRAGENAALVLAGHTLLAQTTDGEIIVGTVSGKGLAPARRYRVADSPTWAHPAATGNRILVKDEKTLAVWAVE
jgi:outer membrane protein assembly factor BamB